MSSHFQIDEQSPNESTPAYATDGMIEFYSGDDI
jgi:hypothetical protein